MRAHTGQVALSAGITALGVLIVAGSFFLPEGGGYAQVGPSLVPRVVGAGLILLGALLIKESLTGGFDGVDEEAEAKLPIDWPAFAWVSGGIIAYGLLVERLGFVFASTILFVMVARGFNSRKWVANIITGVILAAIVFAIFNYGLGLTLPPGILAPLLK